MLKHCFQVCIMMKYAEPLFLAIHIFIGEQKQKLCNKNIKTLIHQKFKIFLNQLLNTGKNYLKGAINPN